MSLPAIGYTVSDQNMEIMMKLFGKSNKTTKKLAVANHETIEIHNRALKSTQNTIKSPSNNNSSFSNSPPTIQSKSSSPLKSPSKQQQNQQLSPNKHKKSPYSTFSVKEVKQDRSPQRRVSQIFESLPYGVQGDNINIIPNGKQQIRSPHDSSSSTSLDGQPSILFSDMSLNDGIDNNNINNKNNEYDFNGSLGDGFDVSSDGDCDGIIVTTTGGGDGNFSVSGKSFIELDNRNNGHSGHGNTSSKVLSHKVKSRRNSNDNGDCKSNKVKVTSMKKNTINNSNRDSTKKGTVSFSSAYNQLLSNDDDSLYSDYNNNSSYDHYDDDDNSIDFLEQLYATAERNVSTANNLDRAGNNKRSSSKRSNPSNISTKSITSSSSSSSSMTMSSKSIDITKNNTLSNHNNHHHINNNTRDNNNNHHHHHHHHSSTNINHPTNHRANSSGKPPSSKSQKLKKLNLDFIKNLMIPEVQLTDIQDVVLKLENLLTIIDSDQSGLILYTNLIKIILSIIPKTLCRDDILSYLYQQADKNMILNYHEILNNGKIVIIKMSTMNQLFPTLSGWYQKIKQGKHDKSTFSWVAHCQWLNDRYHESLSYLLSIGSKSMKHVNKQDYTKKGLKHIGHQYQTINDLLIMGYKNTNFYNLKDLAYDYLLIRGQKAIQLEINQKRNFNFLKLYGTALLTNTKQNHYQINYDNIYRINFIQKTAFQWLISRGDHAKQFLDKKKLTFLFLSHRGLQVIKLIDRLESTSKELFVIGMKSKQIFDHMNECYDYLKIKAIHACHHTENQLVATTWLQQHSILYIQHVNRQYIIHSQFKYTISCKHIQFSNDTDRSIDYLYHRGQNALKIEKNKISANMYLTQMAQNVIMTEMKFENVYNYLTTCAEKAKKHAQHQLDAENAIKMIADKARLHTNAQINAFLHLQQTGEYSKFLTFQKIFSTLSSQNPIMVQNEQKVIKIYDAKCYKERSICSNSSSNGTIATNVSNSSSSSSNNNNRKGNNNSSNTIITKPGHDDTNNTNSIIQCLSLYDRCQLELLDAFNYIVKMLPLPQTSHDVSMKRLRRIRHGRNHNKDQILQDHGVNKLDDDDDDNNNNNNTKDEKDDDDNHKPPHQHHDDNHNPHHHHHHHHKEQYISWRGFSLIFQNKKLFALISDKSGNNNNNSNNSVSSVIRKSLNMYMNIGRATTNNGNNKTSSSSSSSNMFLYSEFLSILETHHEQVEAIVNPHEHDNTNHHHHSSCSNIRYEIHHGVGGTSCLTPIDMSHAMHVTHLISFQELWTWFVLNVPLIQASQISRNHHNDDGDVYNIHTNTNNNKNHNHYNTSSSSSSSGSSTSTAKVLFYFSDVFLMKDRAYLNIYRRYRFKKGHYTQERDFEQILYSDDDDDEDDDLSEKNST